MFLRRSQGDGRDVCGSQKASGPSCASRTAERLAGSCALTARGLVYDSKNRTAWRNDYVDKLARDQIAAKAEHAVLSTLKFPADAKQVHVQDGVIIANPARV